MLSNLFPAFASRLPIVGKRRLRALLVAPILTFFLGETSARAFEKQQHLALTAGPSLFVVSGSEQSKTNVGASIGASYTYGVNDMFNLHVALDGSFFTSGRGNPEKKPLPRQPLVLAGAHVGGSYVIDVLRWVPYVGADLGATAFAGHDFDKATLFPSARAFVGLDYQLSRHAALGGMLRQEFFATRMGSYPSRTELLFKAEYAFGY